MATAPNPLLQTLSISNPCFTSIPSIFNPKSLFFSISSKLSKLPLSVSLSSTQRCYFSPQKRTLSSRVVSCLAQTSDWEQEGPSAVLDEEGSDIEGPDAYDFGLGDAEGEVSDVGPEDNGEGFPENPEGARVFVGNLSSDVDGHKLAQIFERAGAVEFAEVIYSRDTGKSRGFGFVTMSTIEEAEKAVEMFSNYELNGRILTVNIAAPKGSRVERPPREFQPSFRIFVANLPWNVDDTRLKQVFSEHGKVLSARVVSDRETGRSRGFGFVTMASEAEMNDAVSALDGQTLGGRAIRVSVAEERPRRGF